MTASPFEEVLPVENPPSRLVVEAVDEAMFVAYR